jgi:hypothetical protein
MHPPSTVEYSAALARHGNSLVGASTLRSRPSVQLRRVSFTNSFASCGSRLIISHLGRHPNPPTAQCDWPISLTAAAGQSARRCPSWLRDWMPSLMKTFLR